MPFTGGTYLNVFYVADTHIDAKLNPTKLSLFLSSKTITMFFPMRGDAHFRALGILPKQYYHHDEIPFEEIFNEAKKEMGMPVEFYETSWHSTYKLHHKKVQRFRKGNIFFVGDAAHVHSPAGGQGMNTGLLDAYNLAWKLALVLQGKAGANLLDTYHEERNPIAKDLLKTTDRLFAAMTTENAWYAFMRLCLMPFIIPFISKSKFLQKQLFLAVSQIRIHYAASSLSKGKAGKIKAGKRLPYFFVTQQGTVISIYDLLRQTITAPFTILSYNMPANDFASLDTNCFNVLPIEANANNTATLKQIGFPTFFVLVVRPDNYIAYISTTANTEALHSFMKEAYSLKMTNPLP